MWLRLLSRRPGGGGTNTTLFKLQVNFPWLEFLLLLLYESIDLVYLVQAGQNDPPRSSPKVNGYIFNLYCCLPNLSPCPPARTLALDGGAWVAWAF